MSVPPGARPLQDLHRRRGAHALDGGVERLPEDAGGAAAAREVHLRDDRGAQGPGHDPVAVPALRLQAHPRRRPSRSASRRSWRSRRSRPTASAVQVLAREAAGSMRDAMSLLDQVIAFSGTKLDGRGRGARARRGRPQDPARAGDGARVAGDAPACLGVVERLAQQGFDLDARDEGRAAAPAQPGRGEGVRGQSGGEGPALRELLDLADEEMRRRRGARGAGRGGRPVAALPGLLAGVRRRRAQRAAADGARDGARAPGAAAAAPAARRAARARRRSRAAARAARRPPGPAPRGGGGGGGGGRVARARHASVVVGAGRPRTRRRRGRTAPSRSKVVLTPVPVPPSRRSPPAGAAHLPPSPQPAAGRRRLARHPRPRARCAARRSPRCSSTRSRSRSTPPRVVVGFEPSAAFLAARASEPEALEELTREVRAHFGAPTQVALDLSARPRRGVEDGRVARRRAAVGGAGEGARRRRGPPARAGGRPPLRRPAARREAAERRGLRLEEQHAIPRRDERADAPGGAHAAQDRAGQGRAEGPRARRSRASAAR